MAATEIRQYEEGSVQTQAELYQLVGMRECLFFLCFLSFFLVRSKSGGLVGANVVVRIFGDALSSLERSGKCSLLFV